MLIKIIINEKNGNITELYDDDDRNLTDYTNELSTLLDLNNVSILDTTSGNLICRPQDIQSIFVENREDNSISLKPKSEENLNIESKVMDSITDL